LLIVLAVAACTSCAVAETSAHDDADDGQAALPAASWLPADVTAELARGDHAFADEITGTRTPRIASAARLGVAQGWTVLVATQGGDTCLGVWSRAADRLAMNCVASDAEPRPLWIASDAASGTSAHIAAALMPSPVDAAASGPDAEVLPGHPNVVIATGDRKEPLIVVDNDGRSVTIEDGGR
jgi:hypothetical protein